MELSNNQEVDNFLATKTKQLSKEYLTASCNWRITNNKTWRDVFTLTVSSQKQENVNIDEIVSLGTCISLEPTQSSNEPCMLEIKLPNHQKISHIATVSEGHVLEFFKLCGEYQTTVFADLVDEFEDNFVYFAETKFSPPTSEASIKFTKTKSKDSIMWIYGIMLYITEPIAESKTSSPLIFNPEIIKQFLTKLPFNDEDNAPVGIQSCYKNIVNSSINKNVKESHGKEVGQYNKEHTELNVDIKTYIDNKLHDMETRLMKKMNEIEQKTNEKLDNILKQLENNNLNIQTISEDNQKITK
ncbi:uncharacterized protein LOC117229635 [Megalopta genalis]|uniref:uncharacterized protein LOC117229635 n=1 Tax=Megalopta genalis TaxID=115081 RepID=UPI003FD0D85D